MDFEQNRIVVKLTSCGRAKTVTPYPTGLYCKISVGRIDGEDEQEVAAHTVDDLSPELYNSVLDSLKENDCHFGDQLSEVAEHFYENWCD